MLGTRGTGLTGDGEGKEQRGVEDGAGAATTVVLHHSFYFLSL